MTATEKLKLELGNLKRDVQEFLHKLRSQKSVHAFSYKASEQPQKITPNAPPQQFNVIEIRSLITHVLTANSLGYQTILRADDENELRVIFTEKTPLIPASLTYL